MTARRRRPAPEGGPRRILVTGASRGIGRAVAWALAEAGFDLTVHYHANVAAAEETAAGVRARGRDVRLVAFDAADRAGARTLLARELEAVGPCWGVVHNAGVVADGPYAGMSDEAWDRVLRTNLDGFHHVVQPLVLPMVRARRGGRIVTMSSVAGIAGNRGQVNYSASKAGLIGATKALAKELASRRITVNCVAPGFIETEMLGDAPPEELAKLVPMGRLGTPEDVAAVVAFLCSDGASYVTGAVISVNGGML
jgi:3-oxoacyl-[acyl-carrier protein] reductase